MEQYKLPQKDLIFIDKYTGFKVYLKNAGKT